VVLALEFCGDGSGRGRQLFKAQTDKQWRNVCVDGSDAIPSLGAWSLLTNARKDRSD
jgi:hypothetical protein